jgi:phosphatidate cytidylyltransferase
LKTNHPRLFIVLGVIYIGASMTACFLIREDYGLASALVFMSMIWFSDTSAYFAGNLIGGPKLVPRISPNKTWSGLCAALIAPALFVFGFGILTSRSFHEEMILLGLGLMIGLVGQVGDLAISGLKRLVGVKDTGGYIPGHGGILDRMDAMLLAAPVFLAFLVWHGPL